MQRLLEARAAKHQPPQDLFIITRTYDVSDLIAPIADGTFKPTNLWLSKLNAPEATESEPWKAFEIDALMDLVRQMVEPDSWDEIEGARIEPKNRALMVTNVARVQAGIAHLLQQLRDATHARIVVDVVALPVSAQAATLLSQRPRELTVEEARVLADVKPLGSARLVGQDGQRVVSRNGKQRHYLADYDVEIATNAKIGDPIGAEIFEGCSVQIRACLDREANGVMLHCRLERTKIREPMRRLDTEHGPLDLPEMRLTRIGTSLWAPLGRTVVAGGTTDGDQPCIFLLTARLSE